MNPVGVGTFRHIGYFTATSFLIFLLIVSLVGPVNIALSSTIVEEEQFLYHNGPMLEERTMTTPLVKGEISFDQNNIKSFSGATIYVRLEDVTMQDAPSKLISQQVIKNVSYNDNSVAGRHHQKKIKFALFDDRIAVDFTRLYAIRVHIDVDNNGKINSGDLINMESYPVITYGYPKDNVLVHVRQVTK